MYAIMYMCIYGASDAYLRWCHPFSVWSPPFIDTNHNLRNPSYHIFSGCHDIVFEEVESRYIKPGHRVWIEKLGTCQHPAACMGFSQKKQSISRPQKRQAVKAPKKTVATLCRSYVQVYTWDGVVGCGGYLTIASWSKVLWVSCPPCHLALHASAPKMITLRWGGADGSRLDVGPAPRFSQPFISL